MIFDTKTMTPQVYSKERTIQVFNKLLDILFTTCKHDIDNLGSVYDAMTCPKSLLPFLAYTLNYQYNFEDTVTSNRRIIDAFTTMEKYRGCEIGLKMATALSLTSLDVSKNNAELVADTDYINALKDINITYDMENAQIIIDYPNIYTLVRYLLDYVRPVGMYLDLRSIVYHNINTDEMLLYATTQASSKEYIPDMDSFVNRSHVNFSAAVDNDWIEQFTNLSNQTINMNEGE